MSFICSTFAAELEITNPKPKYKHHEKVNFNSIRFFRSLLHRLRSAHELQCDPCSDERIQVHDPWGHSRCHQHKDGRDVRRDQERRVLIVLGRLVLFRQVTYRDCGDTKRKSVIRRNTMLCWLN